MANDIICEISSKNELICEMSSAGEIVVEINGMTYQSVAAELAEKQQQIDVLVVNGDSSPAADQARVDANGVLKNSLKTRLDDDYNRVAAQLAQTEKDGFSANQFLEMPETFLEIPSTIGNALTTHPSVVVFPATWNTYKYWMAHTPYPGTPNENPCIVVSNDNINWIEPAGINNPVVPAPLAPSYNSDTELIYIPTLNKLRLYYREYNENSSSLYSVESSDGITWSAPLLNFSTTDLLLSPSIIIDSGTYKMWSVESGRKVSYRTSTSGTTWSAPSLLDQPHVFWSLWHMGISKDSTGGYHMMASTYPDSESGEGTQYRPIVYAYSSDGLTWTPIEKPQMIPAGWAGGYLYRPSFFVDETKPLQDGLPYIKMWFSASGDAIAAGWHIGYIEGYIMSGDANPSATSDVVKRKKIGEYFKLFASNVVASFAKISRIRTKRLEITSDYSQPLVEWRDGRPDRGGGNYLRSEYLGGETASLIRYRDIYTDNDNNTFFISTVPFSSTPTVSFSNPTDLINVRNLFVSEIINKGGGIRSYMDASAFNRITTDITGALQIQLSARGENYVWKFFAGNGALDGGGNRIQNIQYVQITQATAISSAPNGALFEDADGKLKYKNRVGDVTVLTP